MMCIMRQMYMFSLIGMEVSPKWPQISTMFLSTLFWTILHVSGQAYYINLYGLNPYEGIIEISDGLSWYVLQPEGWNDKNAAVACRMLGYSGYAAQASIDSLPPLLSRPVWGFQFYCKGNEHSLSDCNTDKLLSTTSNISVGVMCPANTVPPAYNFILRHTAMNELSKTNINTMNGVRTMNKSCYPEFYISVVYDPKYDQIVYIKDSSVWGCKFGGTKTMLYSFASNVYVTLCAFDTNDRLLFYASNSEIAKLHLDDVTTKPSFILNTTFARSIGLDTVNKEIYWANSYTSSIERAHYDGSSRRSFSSTSDKHVIGFAFSDDNIFWIDTNVSGITKRWINDSTRGDILYPSVKWCQAFYVLGEWLYCIIPGEAILRLDKNGKCGEYYGPFHGTWETIIQYYDTGDSYVEPTCQNLYINLFGLKPNEGVVEISNGVEWQILCANGWDDNDAAVACRMLGHPGEGASSTFNASIAGEADTIWPYQFHCKGDETRLSDCNYTYFSLSNCKPAGLRCSDKTDIQDFFLKRTKHGLSKTNPFTMCGYVNVNTACDLIIGDMVYDSVHDQLVYFEFGSLWGCRFGDRKTEIRTNIKALNHLALDSDDRLLFGVLDNAIVSLKLDNTSSELVVVVNGTSVGMRLVLDTERNEIYWWSGSHHNIIKRISYHGDSEVDVLKTTTYFKTFSFNGEYLFSLDVRGLIRVNVHQNTSEPEVLYNEYGVGYRCSEMYADKKWIYCNYFPGILRLQADGKWGSFHGPLEFSISSGDVIYYHSPVSGGLYMEEATHA